MSQAEPVETVVCDKCHRFGVCLRFGTFCPEPLKKTDRVVALTPPLPWPDSDTEAIGWLVQLLDMPGITAVQLPERPGKKAVYEAAFARLMLNRNLNDPAFMHRLNVLRISLITAGWPLTLRVLEDRYNIPRLPH